jgi:hypothetical protein
MKNLLIYTSIILIVIVVLFSCAEPLKMSMPSPPILNVPPPPAKSKMCVGDKCREMGAVDGGGTTRGHGEDNADDKND